MIALHVWEHEAEAMGSSTIDVHMARLRSKLAGSLVRTGTARGAGYRIIKQRRPAKVPRGQR